ncbi:sushi, von Willebrand factor type A, EGF and pentraxin domain-containing protein 1 isoform X1 [Ixodes scapularis]
MTAMSYEESKSSASYAGGGTEGTTATEAIRVPVVPGTTPCPYNEEEILTLDVRPRSAENRFSLFDSFSGCRLPPAPRNGFAVVRRNTNRLEFYCNRGFNITSTEPMRCLNVAWTWKPPRCLNGTELEDSPQDGIPLWRLARGSPCGNNYGDCAQLCIYGPQHYCCGCQSGYLANGTECIAVTCPPLTPPEHGYIVGECVTTYRGKCVFECDEGFELTAQGSEIRTCQVNGTWSGVTSQCVVKRCGEPPTPVNGYVRDCQEDRAVGTSCTICCIEGYRLVGESTTVCTSSKTWTCPSPASLTRTARLLEDGLNRTYVYKDTFWPRCPSGFRLRGPQLILCGANGHWEAVFGQSTLFNCVGGTEGTTATEAIRVPVVPGTTACPYNEEEILTLDVRPRSAENRFSLFDSFSGCRLPPAPRNGFAVVRRNTNRLEFYCNRGFNITSTEPMRCLNVAWTWKPPRCLNGTASLTRTARLLEDGLNRTYVYKDTFWPRCPSGFRLRGPQLILCGANGHWEAVFGQSTLFNCVDNEEPVIRCPANITQSVRAGRRGAIVMWKQPEARDNSGVLPEIQQDPENIVSPWRFPIGQTAIRFRATDAARLSTECTFTFLKPSKRMLKDTVFFGKEYISTLYVVHVRFLHTGSYQFRTSK